MKLHLSLRRKQTPSQNRSELDHSGRCTYTKLPWLRRCGVYYTSTFPSTNRKPSEDLSEINRVAAPIRSHPRAIDQIREWALISIEHESIIKNKNKIDHIVWYRVSRYPVKGKWKYRKFNTLGKFTSVAINMFLLFVVSRTRKHYTTVLFVKYTVTANKTSVRTKKATIIDVVRRLMTKQNGSISYMDVLSNYRYFTSF